MKQGKRVTIFFVCFLLATVAAACIFFFAVPGLVERSMNRVKSDATAPVGEAAAALHRDLVIADLHADSLLWNRDLLLEGLRGHVDIPRLIRGNVALQCFTVVTKTPKGLNVDRNDGNSDQITLLAVAQRWPSATWRSLKARALYQAEKLHEIEARSEGRLAIVRTRGDLDRFLERRKDSPGLVAGLLGIEGAHCLEGDIANLDVMYEAGFRMIGITHFFDNELGGSAHGVEKGGLTEFGRACVQRMEQLSITIDLAHASPAVIDDVLDMATRPIIVSHTGVKGACDNARNLSDEHLRRIAANGGLIGIGYWDTAVCDTSAKAIADAVAYTVAIVGVDHVALGSDFDGAVETPFDTAGLSQITGALLGQGLAQDDIALIMGANAIRFFRENLPSV